MTNQGSLPEYVETKCYGDIFSFDCGQGHKMRIIHDFFGHSANGTHCGYTPGDCVISNSKATSLIHRYCTGRRRCTYYQVERRGCDGKFSNYQQVEYQCVPGNWCRGYGLLPNDSYTIYCFYYTGISPPTPTINSTLEIRSSQSNNVSSLLPCILSQRLKRNLITSASSIGDLVFMIGLGII